MGLIASATYEARKADRVVPPRLLITLFVILRSFGVFSLFVTEPPPPRTRLRRSFRSADDSATSVDPGLADFDQLLGRRLAQRRRYTQQATRRQLQQRQPKVDQQQYNHRRYRGHHYQQPKEPFERRHQAHNRMRARRQRPKLWQRDRQQCRGPADASAQPQTAEDQEDGATRRETTSDVAVVGVRTARIAHEESSALGAVPGEPSDLYITEESCALGDTCDATKTMLAAVSNFLVKTAVAPPHEVATDDSGSEFEEVADPDFVENASSDYCEEMEISVSRDEGEAILNAASAFGIGPGWRRVKFSPTARVRRTFSRDEYDRTAVPIAKLSFADYSEFLQIKSELRKQIEETLRRRASEQDVSP